MGKRNTHGCNHLLADSDQTLPIHYQSVQLVPMMPQHIACNLTVAGLRASLGVAPRADTRAQPRENGAGRDREKMPATSRHKIPPRPDHAHIESQLRPKFAHTAADRQPDVFGQFTSIFAMCGRSEVPMDVKQRMLHAIVVDKHYTIQPLLGRVAQRKLQQGKLERLETALETLKDPDASDPAGLSHKPIWWIVADIR